MSKDIALIKITFNKCSNFRLDNVSIDSENFGEYVHVASYIDFWEASFHNVIEFIDWFNKFDTTLGAAS